MGIRTYLTIAFVFSALTLTGGEAWAKKKPGAGGQNTHLKQLELRLERLLQPSTYKYDPSGKPDPFRPFIQTRLRRTAPRKKVEAATGLVSRKRSRKDCLNPLECMDVGQLTLVGIVQTEGSGAIAMAQDSAGVGYIIRVGDEIGFNDGRVTEIRQDRVIVMEKVEDIEGNLVSRKRVLLLHPEEE